MKRTFTLAVLVCCLALTLVNPAYAQDNGSDVNLLDLPKNVARALGIPLYAGQLLTCAVFIFWLVFPTVIFVRKHLDYILILEGFILLALFIALSWIEFWYMLVYVLVVVGLFAGRMRGIFGGRD